MSRCREIYRTYYLAELQRLRGMCTSEEAHRLAVQAAERGLGEENSRFGTVDATFEHLQAQLDAANARVAELQKELAEAKELARQRGEEVVGRGEDVWALEEGIERIVRELFFPADVDNILGMETEELFGEIERRIRSLMRQLVRVQRIGAQRLG